MSEQRKAVVKNADMSEDMQQDAVDCASQAISKFNIEKVRSFSFDGTGEYDDFFLNLQQLLKDESFFRSTFLTCSLFFHCFTGHCSIYQERIRQKVQSYLVSIDLFDDMFQD